MDLVRDYEQDHGGELPGQPTSPPLPSSSPALVPRCRKFAVVVPPIPFTAPPSTALVPRGQKFTAPPANEVVGHHGCLVGEAGDGPSTNLN